MALTIGGKRVTVPGGSAPATPLSPLERLLVDGLIIVNREIVNAINAESFADAIRGLDPDMFDRLLNEALRWEDVREILDNALRGVVLDGSLAQARDIIRNNPRIQQSPFADLQYTGRQLPSGIILPSDFAPPSPDVEFVISTPVEQMFNYVSEASVNYSRVRSGQLIRSIDESTRLSVRELITQAFTEPRSVDDTARLIRRIVGLHPRWARAVERFHDKNVQGLIRDGMSSSQAQRRADEMTAKYRDKLIRRRAEMIARTETQQALNFGRQMSWVASDRAGLVDPRTMKEWRTAPLGSRYGPPCPTCTTLRGTRVAWNGTFDNGQQMPPAHPNCRCTAVLIPPSRGLKGLPSQVSTESWIAELDALEAEQIRELEAQRVSKHKGGGHDQKSHGAWAKGKKLRNQDEPMNPETAWVHEATWYHGTSRPDLDVLDARGRTRYPAQDRYYAISGNNFATTDKELAARYARESADMDIAAGVEGVRPTVYRVVPTSDYFDPDPHSGPGGWNDGPEDMNEAFYLHDNGAGISVRFHDVMDIAGAFDAETGEELSVTKMLEMLKHQRGKHDQASHGAWAKGSGDRAAQIADAARTGAPSGITLEDLVAIQDDPAAFGFEPDGLPSRYEGDESQFVGDLQRAVIDGHVIREARQGYQSDRAAELTDAQKDDLVDYFETIRSKGTVFVAANRYAAADIVNKGEFDTVFETNTSNGAVNYEARRREEFASHDLHPNVDPNLRPIYGYVAFDNPNVQSVDQYGDVRFELKPEVKERTTMTDGDSLGSRATPIPMSGDPITQREAVGGSMGHNSFTIEETTIPKGEELIREAHDTRGRSYGYTEAQIKKGLKIDDVARIHVAHGRQYKDQSVSPYLLRLEEAAEQRGIEVIYDDLPDWKWERRDFGT